MSFSSLECNIDSHQLAQSDISLPQAIMDIMSLQHPYLPQDVAISGYVPNSWNVPELIVAFFGVCVVLLGATYIAVTTQQPTLSYSERLTVMWFVLSGLIHVIFERHYVLNYWSLASKQTIMAQIWKEYSLSDSRYLTQDSFVLAVESAVVVLWGPGCLIVAYLAVLRHPLRHPLQIVVSMGELCGVLLYYVTAAFDHILHGLTYSRPEALYFWFYFIFLNGFWVVVVPIGEYLFASQFLKEVANCQAALVCQSVLCTANAIATAGRKSSSDGSNANISDGSLQSRNATKM